MSRLEDAIFFLDVKGWVSQYVDTKDASQGNFRVEQCPKCMNENWKLYVHSEKRRWYCQVCQWGTGVGDICVLLAEVSGMNLHDVRQQLMQTVTPAPIDEEYISAFLNKLDPEQESEEIEALDTVTIPGDRNFLNVNGKKVKEYAYSRGLTDDLIEEYNLGVSNKLRNIYGPWLVFPINYFGLDVAYQGRCINSHKEPKYLSSETIDQWVWPITPKCIEEYKEKSSIILVEGVFDALGFRKAGLHAACTFGKTLKRKQAAFLKSMGIKELYFAYDPEGTWGSTKTQIKEYGFMFDIHVLDMDFRGDPGDALTGHISTDTLVNSYYNKIDTKSDSYFDYFLKKDFS